MPAAVVAFAFGSPNTLRSNRAIAEMASAMAAALGLPVYAVLDVCLLRQGVEVHLTAENYPERLPTLREARGAVAWALERRIDLFWLCAATPHVVRCRRDLAYAIRERDAAIAVKIAPDAGLHPDDFWFCPDSTQLDTRISACGDCGRLF